MITFHRILDLYEIDPNNVRLVRHSNNGFPRGLSILEAFRTNKELLEGYQSFQGPNTFQDAKHIAVFSSLAGNAALFLGLWDIADCVANNEFTDRHRALIDQFSFPQEWANDSVWYDLQLNQAMQDLSERLVIDWGPGAINWVARQNKNVLEIKRPNSIGDFVSYSATKLSYFDLQKLMRDANANLTWRNALSAVNGVYLVRDKSSGKMYVGSAYGEQGIYGRWRTYANNGHGDNVLLIKLDHTNFEFSILEIAPATLSKQEVIQIENKWKDRLGTRLFEHLNSAEVTPGRIAHDD